MSNKNYKSIFIILSIFIISSIFLFDAIFRYKNYNNLKTTIVVAKSKIIKINTKHYIKPYNKYMFFVKRDITTQPIVINENKFNQLSINDTVNIVPDVGLIIGIKYNWELVK